MKEANPPSDDIILNTGWAPGLFFFFFFNLQYYSRCTPMNDDTAQQLFFFFFKCADNMALEGLFHENYDESGYFARVSKLHAML